MTAAHRIISHKFGPIGAFDATNPAVVDRLASQMAAIFNGGSWVAHYTEDQKEVWRKRVRMILNREI